MSQARGIVKVTLPDTNTSFLKLPCLLSVLDTHTNLFGVNEFEQVLYNRSAKHAISSCNNDHETLLLLFVLRITLFVQGLTLVVMYSSPVNHSSYNSTPNCLCLCLREQVPLVQTTFSTGNWISMSVSSRFSPRRRQ